MCVIIDKPRDIEMSKETTKQALVANPDGFGYMYVEDGKIISDKFLPGVDDLEKVWDIVDNLQSKHVVYHFRITTHGGTIQELCHPFRITSLEDDGQDVLFMHNGIISKHGNVKDKGVSDTTDFNEKILTPMFKSYPDLLSMKSMTTLIGDYIGSSKLAIMKGDGEVFRINDNLWKEHKGLMCSNLNFDRVVKSYGGHYSNKWYDDYPDYDYETGVWSNNTTYKKNTSTATVKTVEAVDNLKKAIDFFESVKSHMVINNSIKEHPKKWAKFLSKHLDIADVDNYILIKRFKTTNKTDQDAYLRNSSSNISSGLFMHRVKLVEHWQSKLDSYNKTEETLDTIQELVYTPNVAFFKEELNEGIVLNTIHSDPVTAAYNLSEVLDECVSNNIEVTVVDPEDEWTVAELVTASNLAELITMDGARIAEFIVKLFRIIEEEATDEQTAQAVIDSEVITKYDIDDLSYMSKQELLETLRTFPEDCVDALDELFEDTAYMRGM